MASVGIDIGDARTTVSVISAQGGRPSEARNEMTKTTTPTAFYFKDGTFKIGQAAMKQVTRRNCFNPVVSIQSGLSFEICRSASLFLKVLRTPVQFYTDFDFPNVEIDDFVWKQIVHKLRGSTVGSQDEPSDTHVHLSLRFVLAIFLVKVLEPVVTEHTTIESCVVSCSDAYSAREQEILKQSCEMALGTVSPSESKKRCVKVLHCCLAAALYHARDRPENLFARNAGRACPVAFVDVGKHSTSISVITFDAEGAVIRAIETSKSVSGLKIDNVIYKHVCDWLLIQFSIDASSFEKPVMLRILVGCKRAKEELSLAESHEIDFDGCFPGKEVKPFNLSQQELNMLCGSIFNELRMMSARVLASAGLRGNDVYGQPEKVHSIELIGNGCLSPSLKSVIRDSFLGVEPRVSLPDEFVSRGCAYFAYERITVPKNDGVASYYELAASEESEAEMNGSKNQISSVPFDSDTSRFLRKQEMKLLLSMKQHERNATSVSQSEDKQVLDRRMNELRIRDRTPVKSDDWVSEMGLVTYAGSLPDGMSDLEGAMDQRLAEIVLYLRRIPYLAGDAIEELKLLTERLEVTANAYNLMKYASSLPCNMGLRQHAAKEKNISSFIEEAQDWTKFFLLPDNSEVRRQEPKGLSHLLVLREEILLLHDLLCTFWEINSPDFEQELRHGRSRGHRSRGSTQH